MIFIAHRGNINGKNPDLENKPSHILQVLEQGFHVEIDVRYIDDKFVLSHDLISPEQVNEEYIVDESFLEHPNLWCHAKDAEAFEMMLMNVNIHCFYHENDEYTLTSKGIIWSYPGALPIYNSILLNFDKNYTFNEVPSNCLGICSDYVEILFEQYKIINNGNNEE